ncbi:cytochrome P450, partial [Tanacetum coccineum]
VTAVDDSGINIWDLRMLKAPAAELPGHSHLTWAVRRSRTTIVVSSPDIAKEFFQTNDQFFSSRSIPDSGQVVDHDKYSIVWLPVGDQWRKLRRITKEYMFSLQHLDASEVLRKEKVQDFVNHVDHCCISEKPVNIASSNSKRFVRSLLEIGGKPNLADFFPILKPFEPAERLYESKMYTKVQGFIVPQKCTNPLKVWSDGTRTKKLAKPRSIFPERFLDVKIDIRAKIRAQAFGARKKDFPVLNMAS